MPHLPVNGTHLFYEINGNGPETIVFSHGLLMDGTMFGGQVRVLSEQYRCICYDHRGQGRSEAGVDPYDIDTLAADAEALIETLDAAPCHFAGLSMGGFVGLRLALRRPELLRSLVLIASAADADHWFTRVKYRAMANFGQRFGLGPLAGALMKMMFGRTFLSAPGRAAEREHWRQHILSLDRDGIYPAALSVIDRDGVENRLGEIGVPTLVVTGAEDVSLQPERSKRMSAAIPGARLVVIPGTGHSPSIERPDDLTSAIREFLVTAAAGPGR